MGMDVYGKKPVKSTGEYFRNNVWWWHPLWDYCCDVAGDIIPDKAAEYCHSNSGAGLGAVKSRQLAKRLRERIADGSCARYAADRAAALKALPDETCTLCGGTGMRDWQGGKAGCNACGSSVDSMEPGTGKRRPYETRYPFDVDNVAEWCEFLENCGGFKVC